MKVYELPHDKFMPLLLGVCLAKANDRLGGFCNPRVVSDSKFFATDIVLDDNVPLTEHVRDKERLDSLLSQ